MIEDLNVSRHLLQRGEPAQRSGSGMMANHKLAASVQDMGFYEFRRQLEYKCELYGSELLIFVCLLTLILSSQIL